MSEDLIAPIDSSSARMLVSPKGDDLRKKVAALDTSVDRTAGVDKLLGEFQEIFLNEMMKAMRETVPESSLFEDDSMAMDTFQSLLDQEYVRLGGEQLSMPEITEALKRQLGLIQNPADNKNLAIPPLPDPMQNKE